MFVDQVKVYARAGHGGKGCVAFHREAYAPKGGPIGGNGGRGGDVILEADQDVNSLVAQFYHPRLLAENGHPGMGKGKDGPAGKDIVIKVPCGTLVWHFPSKPAPPEPEEPEGDADEADEESPAKPAIFQLGTAKRPIIRQVGKERAMEFSPADEAPPYPDSTAQEDAEPVLVADLTEHHQRFLLCKGGRGGLGNRNFATARRQAPRFAQPGEPGLEGNYRFELRMVAEVGLVGWPNAGKSTLLTAISAARPKIAPYPFTTLHPQVGILEYKDYHRLTICDVPGLIEGAHKNVGLGHGFLRHIARCKVLVILVDMAGTDARLPWDDYKLLLNELGLHDPSLLLKPRIVVANKMDEPVAEANLVKFKRRVPKTPVLPISAAFDQGIEKFKQMIRDAVARVDQG
jgi:GTP-binding protein